MLSANSKSNVNDKTVETQKPVKNLQCPKLATSQAVCKVSAYSRNRHRSEGVYAETTENARVEFYMESR